MKKLPLLFFRNPDGTVDFTKYNEIAISKIRESNKIYFTLKYDGTCVLVKKPNYYARRTVKPGKNTPKHFIRCDFDKVTGKSFGWIPIDESDYKEKFYKALFDYQLVNFDTLIEDGTYELCGPKIGVRYKNSLKRNVLFKHGKDIIKEVNTNDGHIFDISPIDLKTYLIPIFKELNDKNIEGIVFWNDDGPICKLRCKDFNPSDLI